MKELYLQKIASLRASWPQMRKSNNSIICKNCKLSFCGKPSKKKGRRGRQPGPETAQRDGNTTRHVSGFDCDDETLIRSGGGNAVHLSGVLVAGMLTNKHCLFLCKPTIFTVNIPYTKRNKELLSAHIAQRRLAMSPEV